MIQRIKNGLKKRKAKIFLTFLLCSAMAWFVNKLSNSYISNTTFDLQFVNVPDTKKLTSASKEQIDVKVEAVGFQLLGFDFRNKLIQIDLSTIEKNEGRFYISAGKVKKQIEKQLPSSMRLLELEEVDLMFELQEIISKTVPVIPQMELNLAQNYLLEGKVTLSPSSVTIKGPKNEVDTIENVKSIKLDLTDLTSNFSKEVAIYKSEALKNTSFSDQSVTITGRVSRFSEKMVEVAIKVINVPRGTEIKIFPRKVTILCKAPMSILKGINRSDFQVVADYGRAKKNNARQLSLTLRKKPKNLYSAIVKEKKVEFVIQLK